MRWLRAWFRRHEDDLQREIDANLQMQIEDNIRAGMTPEEARRKALIQFGSIDAAKEAVRDRRGFPFLAGIARDIRFALGCLIVAATRQNAGTARPAGACGPPPPRCPPPPPAPP
jgi:hypothetical protein